jgi:catechol 2,3-dioxygenase-like lactoylglutathione lyase family enzyme
MLSAFDHVTVVVPELHGALERFGVLLGAPPFFVGGHPELGTESALFGLANAALEVVAPKPVAQDAEGLGEGLRELIARTGGGLQAVAFATADADQLSSALRERGVRATKPQPGTAVSEDGTLTRSYRTVELSPKATRGLAVLAVERPQPLLSSEHVTSDPSCVHALDHVVIRTADTDAARTLYGEQLGIRLALERDLRGTRMLFFRVGGVTLEVVLDPALGASDALWGHAFRVRDIDAAHARMRAAGFSLSELRDGLKPGTRIFTVRNDTGNVPTLILYDPARER